MAADSRQESTRSMQCEEIHGRKSLFLENLQTSNCIIGMKAIFQITFEPCIFFFQIVVFQVVTPCSVIGGYQRFGRTCCFHLKGTTSILKLEAAGTSKILRSVYQTAQNQSHAIILLIAAVRTSVLKVRIVCWL